MEKEMDLHQYKRKYDLRLQRIENSKEISPEDKNWIFKFRDFCLCKNITYGKIDRYILDIEKFIRMLKVPIEKATKEDVMRVVAEFNQSGCSDESKKAFKIMLRRLYRIVRGIEEKGIYPDEVKWISIGMPSTSKKLPEELLTEQEIKDIIQNCLCLRDKAFVASLAESGCRISEIGTLRIKHVSFEEHGARLVVSGKTGMRKVLLVNSAPYLQEWINQHPMNNDPSAPLWYHTQKKGYLGYGRITRIIKSAAKRAGIKKRVYPHLFRHSRATAYASIMSDSSMKHYFGWTQGSKMASIYIHMSGKETDDAILKANGLKIIREETTIEIKPKKCLRCKTSNPVTNKYCSMCSMVLDEGVQREMIRKDAEKMEVDTFMNQLMKDKEVMELLMKKIREKQPMGAEA